MYTSRSSFAGLLCIVAAVLLAAHPAHAALQEPPSIMPLVGATSPLTPDQQRDIDRYAEYWIGQLNSGDFDRVGVARRRLLDPLRAAGVRMIFRDQYARAALPRLESLIERDANLFVAVNALQITAFFGTESAIRVLLNRADPDAEPRHQLRLWAAHGFRIVIEDGQVDSARLTSLARDISRLAQRETNWMVLQRHFEALAAMNIGAARERQIELFQLTLDRIAEADEGPSEYMQVVQRVLLLFRDQYLNLPSQAQREFGTAVAPQMGRVFNVASSHWDAALEDQAAWSFYGGSVRSAESMLKIIDAQVRGATAAPRTSMDAAWAERNKSNFQRDAQQWTSVLGQPPYRR